MLTFLCQKKGCDSMAFYFGINSEYASSFFQSSFSFRGRNFLNTSSEFNTLYNGLGDYGTVKSGTYNKLLKAYYKKVQGSNEKSEEIILKKQQSSEEKATAVAASSLKYSSDALTSLTYSEENRSEIVNDVEQFVNSYNTAINVAKSSSVASVNKKGASLSNLSSSYSKVLDSVGITVNKDHSLSVNSDKLKSANLGTLKTIFQGNYSYSSQVNNYANLMYSANSNGVEGSYNRKGQIDTLSNSSILNTLI